MTRKHGKLLWDRITKETGSHGRWDLAGGRVKRVLLLLRRALGDPEAKVVR